MFINEHRDRWPIRVMCHVLKVSHSGYYAWRKRPEPEDSSEQRDLLQRIRAIFKQSKKSAGTRRIVKALREPGEIVGRYRVIAEADASTLRKDIAKCLLNGMHPSKYMF